jgi:hypothetical protein
MSLRLLGPLAAFTLGASVFTVAAEPAVDATPDTSAAASAAATPVDPRIAAILKSLGEVKQIEAVALSPDGQKLAWEVREQGKPQIEVASVDGHDVRRIGTADRPDRPGRRIRSIWRSCPTAPARRRVPRKASKPTSSWPIPAHRPLRSSFRTCTVMRRR